MKPTTYFFLALIAFGFAIMMLFSCTKTNQTVIDVPVTTETWLGFIIKSDTLIGSTYCIKDFDNPKDTIRVQHEPNIWRQNGFFLMNENPPYIYAYFKIKLWEDLSQPSFY